ncbi:uncharacterized protein B0I36DRAFT_362337 [Microdochium trichocladiopsis]|uniref:tRNA-intron lyase n=1 Tax=Microdochium trichocladiopsis TaxID=1682393 RepID=A0A9P8YCR3_9PEZI|nr:uncharacterized protein B0I36DRAFT_362337 [Microdochium trichocladiopsis]KAH7033698.1 hypothetical protein B0I36DRAFT_362337 [Microdochium trichocladiopsis]
MPDPAVAPNGHLPAASTPPATGALDVKPPSSSNSSSKNSSKKGSNNARSQAAKKQPLHQLYTLPAPIRTFPLPSFYPNNPLSLFHVLYAWLRQTVAPPPREPAVVHKGIWSPETRSVHIVDQQAIRALWEQGFFGKGIYSRSEPNWLRREQSRRGEHAGHVAENFTAQRRRERNQMKWERARKEQEAIQRTRMQEAWVAPVGPMELLALPNSALELGELFASSVAAGMASSEVALEASHVSQVNDGTVRPQTPVVDSTSSSPPDASLPKLQKSVRFSPKVEATTFEPLEPPSPGAGSHVNGQAPHANGGLFAAASKPEGEQEATTATTTQAQDSKSPGDVLPRKGGKPANDIKDIEHLQLAPEEALYLSFAMGVLEVVHPKTGQPIPPRQQFAMYRELSAGPRIAPAVKLDNSPAGAGPGSAPPSSSLVSSLRPDDPFLLHYATYHHFRSLGWVVRPGIKFGVDWLLYHRGPVFSHAEFAVLVLPAYTHPWWTSAEAQAEAAESATGAGGKGPMAQRRSWHWLHCANRVQAKALKTLVLVYVDVPPPRRRSCKTQTALGRDHEGKGEEEGGDDSIADVLSRYKIREFMVKRWLSNRNRD